jgi:Glycoside hydrolase family 44/Secretion system C-terminal sorting domain
VLDPNGTKAKVEDDPELYLENWTADSTVGILDHWFGDKGLSINKNKVIYWGMDNEPGIWLGTHDDIMTRQISAEDFIQKYVEVSVKAKAKYPNIKLLGPIAANEWQWYNYDKGISYNGKKFNWSEYFIMRLAEIQKTKNVKLLDVFDVHFYPSAKSIDDITQLHRVFFDKDYVWPEANGVKNISGNWDNSQTKEYYFARVNDWLKQYFGENHGIKLGMSETGINDVSASATALWYANTLGTFMKKGVELFTPWSWKKGMWETLHLFTKYNKPICVGAKVDKNEMVMAYPTINTTNDTLTFVLVNRSQTASQNAIISFENFKVNDKTANMYSLKSLPNQETFFSTNKNALTTTSQVITNNSLTVSVAPLSVNSIQLTGKEGMIDPVLGIEENETLINIYPNPVKDIFTVEWEKDFEKLEIVSEYGAVIYHNKLSVLQRKSTLKAPESIGTYFMVLSGKNVPTIKKIIKN